MKLAVLRRSECPDLACEKSLLRVAIRRALREILDGELPQKHEVARACAHMSKIAKEELGGEPVIEWDGENDKFYITDPFLMFYMRWEFGQAKEVEK